MEKCFENIARSCLYGPKPTYWDELEALVPFVTNWVKLISKIFELN